MLSLDTDYHGMLTKKLVYHIHKVGRSKGRHNLVTPREFHLEILPHFSKVANEVVTKIFFTITTIEAKKHVYHKLRDQYQELDKGFEAEAKIEEGDTDRPNLFG